MYYFEPENIGHFPYLFFCFLFRFCILTKEKRQEFIVCLLERKYCYNVNGDNLFGFMSIYNSEMCAVLEVNEKNRAGLM